MAQVITNTNIEEVLACGQPVVIDFWATWCGPCKVISPLVDEAADEFAGRVVVAKCNVDDAEDVAMQFRIRNIPTMLFFKNGELVDRNVGVISKEELTAKIEALL